VSASLMSCSRSLTLVAIPSELHSQSMAPGQLLKPLPSFLDQAGNCGQVDVLACLLACLKVQSESPLHWFPRVLVNSRPNGMVAVK
jgi:hypothetical protein